MSTIRFAGSARSWLERLPLGDGRLGAMTDGGVWSTSIQLNDATAWSGSPSSEGEPPSAEACAAHLAAARAAIAEGDPIAAEAPLAAMQTAYAQSFLPVGTLRIDATPKQGGVTDDDLPLTRELDLGCGTHRSAQGTAAATTFISDEHSVLVHVIEPARELRLTLSSPLHGPDSPEPVTLTPDAHTHTLLLRLPSDVAPGHEPDLPAARWSAAPGDALRAAIAARVVEEEGRTIVLLATATTFDGLGRAPRGTAEDALADALGRIADAAALGVDELRTRAEERRRAVLGRVSLSFDPGPAEDDTARRLAAARESPAGILAADPGLAALLFDYGRYLLVASSRPDGLPATLQGIWNAQMQPPWGSGYTLNINTEMNYWGAHVSALSAQAEPLAALTRELAKAAPARTRRLYGAPGWTVHHNTDAWLYATSPGRGAGDPRWSFWPLGGAWLASLLTEAWEFGATDDAALAENWSALREAARFALSWHHEGRTSPATSPENAYLHHDGRPASLAETSTMDLALLRQLFEKTVLTARILHIDDEVAREAAQRLDALPEQPEIAPDGRLVEWDRDRPEEDPTHRHLSHLFGLFPGTQRWDDAHRSAASATLDARGDDSSGWSLTWKLALRARLQQPSRTGDLLELFFRDADSVSGPWAGGLYPNLFAAHPPFQIDANLGFVGALAECLLQSHDGIRLLPAVPPALSTGDAAGLIARPGVVVDLRWENGSLTEARLRARTPRAAGRHAVRWGEHRIDVDIAATHDTVLDPSSFITPREAHP